MSAILVVQGIAVFTTGLLAGILFGDRAGNSYARAKVPAAAFLAFQREQNRRFAAMMPLPILAAAVASAAWLVLVRSRSGAPDFVLLAAGAACLVLIVAITRIVNIPINRRIDARAIFSCELAALAVSRGATP